MSTRLRASGLLAAPVAVGLLVAVVSALLVGDARSASQGSGLIAFTRDDGVYVVGVDGTGLHPLWQGKRTPMEVTWSPDGRKLAFGGGGIWVMNAWSNPVRVASVAVGSLTWSPDGRRIAFTRWYESDNPDIWVMDADGSNIRRLKRTPELSERNVDWRPTGGWLAFDRGGYVSQLCDEDERPGPAGHRVEHVLGRARAGLVAGRTTSRLQRASERHGGVGLRDLGHERERNLAGEGDPERRLRRVTCLVARRTEDRVRAQFRRRPHLRDERRRNRSEEAHQGRESRLAADRSRRGIERT